MVNTPMHINNMIDVVRSTLQGSLTAEEQRQQLTRVLLGLTELSKFLETPVATRHEVIIGDEDDDDGEVEVTWAYSRLTNRGGTPLFSVPAAYRPVRCSVCDSTHNVQWVGGSTPYLCENPECVPY